MTEFESGGFPTLADIATRVDPNGATVRIVNVLEQKNPILEDIPWMAGDLPTGKEVNYTDTALPTGTFRGLNQGVPGSKAHTVTYTESCTLLEDHSKLDQAAAPLKGGAAWRESEDLLKMKSLPQQFATALFYHSASSNARHVHGLTARYPGTSGSRTIDYVVKGTNAGVNSRSAWLITPEIGKVYCIYPPGTKLGLTKEDMGVHPVNDEDSNPYFALWTRFQWWMGVVVEDYRYAVRIQWDPDDPEMAVGEKGLINLFTQAYHTIQEVTPNTRFYTDRTTSMRLNLQMVNNHQNGLEFFSFQRGKFLGDSATLGGQRVTEFAGVPMRITDALTAETAVT